MLGVGRPAGNPDRPKRDHGCGQIQAGVQGLGHDTQAACPQAHRDLGASQKQCGHNGKQGYRPLLAVRLGISLGASVQVMVMIVHVSRQPDRHEG